MKSSIFLPNPAVSHMVKYFWTLSADAAAQVKGHHYRFMTDGYPELMIHFGEISRQSFGGQPEKVYQDAIALVGVSSRNANFQLMGATQVLLVKLQPWGLRQILGDAAIQATDRQIDWDCLGHLRKRNFLHAVQESPDLQTAIQRLEQGLLSLSDDWRQDLQVMAAIQRILATRGQVSIADLERVTELGMRRLEQRFKDEIGVSPKQYARIVRSRFAAEAITSDQQHDSLTDLAYLAGYYDQAHFIREFKEFSGLTPRQFAQRMRGKESVYQLEIDGSLRMD